MTINASDLLSGASANRSTTSVVNTDSNFNLTSALSPRIALSGPLTAATLKTMVNLSGVRGVVALCAIRTADATARTIRLRITCDGTVVYDKSSAVSSLGQGIFSNGFSGTGSTNPLPVGANMLRFQSTFVIEISSSLSETDKVLLLYDYALEA